MATPATTCQLLKARMRRQLKFSILSSNSIQRMLFSSHGMSHFRQTISLPCKLWLRASAISVAPKASSRSACVRTSHRLSRTLCRSPMAQTFLPTRTLFACSSHCPPPTTKHGVPHFSQRTHRPKLRKRLPEKKVPPKKVKGPEVPIDLFAALHADTGELQTAGWNLPPGASFVNYTRPADAFAPVPRVSHLSDKHKPTVARYAVVSAVSPRLTKAVSIANRVHDALCKWSDTGNGAASVFTGTSSDGKPLEGHNHAHIFCEANDLRDAITHLTVWSANGFDEQACLALRRLNKVWGHGGHDLRLVLIGLGQPETFPDCKLFGDSKVWRSATPFVPTRHAKIFRDGRPKIDTTTGWQIGSSAHDLLRILTLNPLTAKALIRQDKFITINKSPSARMLNCLQFQTKRHDGGGSRGQGVGASFTITFPQKVTGPLAFGYGAHFGLGLFLPTNDP